MHNILITNVFLIFIGCFIIILTIVMSMVTYQVYKITRLTHHIMGLFSNEADQMISAVKKVRKKVVKKIMGDETN